MRQFGGSRCVAAGLCNRDQVHEFRLRKRARVLGTPEALTADHVQQYERLPTGIARWDTHIAILPRRTDAD
jgi:hypothetical protein